ncbi:MAG TPA: hypothetical protein VL403_04965 [Candidatus Kryptonia bacterium]|nr:hypothetical protein [Candidatus Kryptonia bacterium]
MNTPDATFPFSLRSGHGLLRLQRTALGIGVPSLALAGLGGFFNPEQFFRSYLVAFLFWFGIALGSMAILMIHHIAGGAWGAVIRRLLESGTRTLPLLALLFLPLLLGMRELYEWARPEIVAHDEILQHKAPYLNVPFFALRAVIYFAAWLLLSGFLNRWSLEQDRAPSASVARRLENLSRGGLLLVGLTMTFAAIDWAMSLEPHWYSTIYSILIMGGQVLTAMAFVIPMAAWLAQDDGPLADIISPEQFHDLGKLLLAFVMLWTYFSLSQFLIIWSANLPEEIPWYLHRTQGGWQVIAIGLILFHFALPFLILLSRDIKRNARALAIVALGMMVVRFVELFWLITPAFEPSGFTAHWLDLVTLIGVGGLWLSFYVYQLKGRPVVPMHDPSLPLLIGPQEA